jgi:hypothetical protein
LSEEPGIIGNKCYGNNLAIKRKLKKNYDSHCMIEHGMYFNKIVIKDECLIKSINTIYTYGEYRVKAIKEYFNNDTFDKKIIPIGPYILFAKHFHNLDKLFQLKKKYGKILLVFPSHSYPDEPVFFDTNSLINEIERISYKFDTVFISLYYFDIKNGLHKDYLAKGYTVVCSGTRSDCYFLSRLKDLIQLSDITMSNNIGTHIGYCIAMNRPHYLFKQFIDESCYKNSLDENEKMLFYKCFSDYCEEITDDQINLIKYYWGTF